MAGAGRFASRFKILINKRLGNRLLVRVLTEVYEMAAPTLCCRQELDCP